ncbi:MAG: hypothetical protein HY426_02930 [Candidatus Levybacteria bacterium]|nr:hypothetical protein [Candidatus Levybacteria bacterium]
MVTEREGTRGVAVGHDGPVTYLEYDGVKIPIYDFRDLDHQRDIAKAIANGASMAMFAGVWGGFKGVRKGTEDEPFFHKAKAGRPSAAKVAVMVPPTASIELIDWTRVHPEVRHLEDYGWFKRLWADHGGYLHVIAPTRDDSPVPDIFVTSPGNHSELYPNYPQVNVATACFFWREDPYLEHLLQLVDGASSDKDIYIGGTSLNPHGESPPFSFIELNEHLKAGKSNPRDINLVVRDPSYESSEALGSHTQVRLPLVGEEPVVLVYRIGTLSPEGFASSTGIRTHVMRDARDVRKNLGENVDSRIREVNLRIHAQWQQMSASITSSM